MSFMEEGEAMVSVFNGVGKCHFFVDVQTEGD